MPCDNPNCDCDHKKHHHHHEEGRGGAGFALGVAIGAAVAVLMTPEEGKKVRTKARKKLDELTGGKAPDELLDSLKNVVGTVIEDIQDAGKEAKSQGKRTRKDVMDGTHPVTKPPRKRRKK